MFDKLKSLFTKPEAPVVAPVVEKVRKPKKPRSPKVEKSVVPPEVEQEFYRKLEKEKATAEGRPWVSIIKVDIDPQNINNGGFELDWNVPFLKKLIRAGYHQKESDTDEVMVDRWFSQVCRNVALEIYQQDQADPTNRGADDVRPPLAKKDLGDGRTEIS